jgi:hypothetical protein
MTYELANGVTLGSKQITKSHHKLKSQGNPAITKLAIELAWTSEDHQYYTMSTPIVRGSPYTSMIYVNKTLPRILAERPLKAGRIFVDQSPEGFICGVGENVYSEPFLVKREVLFQLDQSDMTWIMFVSAPMIFQCSSYDATQELYKMNIPPGTVFDKPSTFDLVATEYAAEEVMVRVAMVNNCTTGQNAICKLFFFPPSFMNIN